MNSAIKKTVFHSWHKSHGAHMVNFGGWEMPLNYGHGIVEEHLATRKFGGLFDISHMGRFSITGEGALPFLQYVLTNNAAALETGQAQYTILANEGGGAIDDAYLYRMEEDEFFLVVNASNTAKDWNWIQEHLGKFSQVTLEDRTEIISMVAFQGPKTKAILEDILKKSRSFLPDPGRNHLRTARMEGVDVSISRTGYTGEPLGFELFIPAENALRVWEKICLASQEEGILPIGLGARDTLRLEAGLPLYGHELGLDQDGKEIPVLSIPPAKVAVSFSGVKGDFIGKNSLWKQFQELKNREEVHTSSLFQPLAVPRRVWPLAILSAGVVRPPSPVYLDEAVVGYVTSGTMVPYWKFTGEGLSSVIAKESGRKAIALAYLDAAIEEDQTVKILSRGKFLAARVVKRQLSSEAPPFARPIDVEEIVVAKPGPKKPLATSVSDIVQKAIKNTRWRQKQTVNLIPSEQTASPLVKLLSISDPCGRYAEHRHYDYLEDAEIFYYQGTAFIEEMEARLREEMARFLGCTAVEIRIISGQMANAAFFSAYLDYLNRFDRKSEPRRLRKVMNHQLGRGGHLSSQPMGALRDFIGVDPQMDKRGVIPFPVLDENPYQVDLGQTEKLLRQHKPELIILGKSMILYREPLTELRRMVDALPEKTLIMYDMAHVLGLIGPSFQQPFLEGADIVTGSTHKTFFGTQRGIIGSNFDETSDYHEIWEAVERRSFPGSVSNHHLGTLLGLLLAAYEMNAFADEYPKQTIANAKAFAQCLKSCGLQVEGDPQIGYTETHQVLLRVGYGRGPEIARRLEDNNIIVNYQALPDDEGFTASSGLRTGVQEMTRFGMKEEDFGELAGIMADIILRSRSAKEEVIRFRSRFTRMEYCLPEEKARPLIEELLKVVMG
ncbi:MAG: glycine cleavage system protein T [Deltaproteobacteria bacterium RBG_19FT_COMBO_52_11]|nr:MAG: glycine cleavage system protein T [Deltaproteobacteria bacterium RBG_19FT_COMBO_52_11]